MIQAIERLRKIADDAEARARAQALSPAVQASMMDDAAKWHWLASQASELCVRYRRLSSNDAACADCAEKCALTRSTVKEAAKIEGVLRFKRSAARPLRP